uniref:YCII-related domain-containing protein n=1 Tax=Chlamydomonas leiostraca TaxID=1034604 RepID=A0A7S0WYM2_9CHLO|eukprot:CAMPEP_0202865980 /NCGR_PEP_ID=MMETSP1391-20130828/6863_1 /ASSEMBLY_ACC=CAM_ASM_000867 /TAXON_ID=1034604 /ORGANISM="Chlamydomonas leiostraca, Strain SAG 11-49" /LENGTH=127 /DNA_ID=CAMNT_0049545873 /DNA_START=32 /DNA_END=415 /DNA_ORIENTATION=+
MLCNAIRQSSRLAQHGRLSRGTSVRCMASAAQAPTYHILSYSYVKDILEKRGPYREAHLAAAQAKADQGLMVMAGAVGSPPEGATFIFRNQSQQDIEAFVQADPYVKNGLVTSWKVSPYTVVVKGQL